MLARQPVVFVENQGQWEGAFSYRARFGPMAVFLEGRGWAFTLTEYKEKTRDAGDPSADREVRELESGRGLAMRMRFVNGAGASIPVPEQRLPGVHHYFLGDDPARWRSDVPLHGSVRMAGLYPGVDVRARSADGHFEYDLLVDPGADLTSVQVEVEGAEGLRIDADGALIMETMLGPVRQPVPKTWQVTARGERREVACCYVLLDEQRFGFRAAGWDRDHALVVDPGLIWSTFLGESGWDDARAMSLGPTGSVTVAGTTASPMFPTTPGAYDTTQNGASDAYVTRLDGTGGSMLWSTFLGGSGDDYVRALELDSTGAVNLVGATDSTTFPTTSGAYATTHNGAYDAFVTRLDGTGSSLLWSTFLGGNANETAYALALDPSGAVAVAGNTWSTTFPTTSGAYDTTYNGPSSDIFVTLFDATGGSLLWSTFLGGSDWEGAYALALGPSGAVTVAGETGSSTFPTTSGAFDTTYNGGFRDVFVTRLDATGSSLMWSTFLGGSDSEIASSLALDNSGAVNVAGDTQSSAFPITPGAFDTTYNGGLRDAFVTRLDATGSSLLWSTFLGGSASDGASSVALDISGAVTVAGDTQSSAFPTTPAAYSTTHNGVLDAFVARLDGTGSSLLWSTFLGGSGVDRAYALALDPSGAVTVAGETESSSFPTTPGAYDTTFNGVRDAFVARLRGDSFGFCMTQAANLAVTVALVNGQPSAPYYIFYSSHPLNSTAHGSGWVFGLHIAVSDALWQLSAGSGGDPLFGGTLDATGSFLLTIPAGSLSSLSGQTWWGVAFQANPSPTGLYEATSIESITFQ